MMDHPGPQEATSPSSPSRSHPIRRRKGQGAGPDPAERSPRPPGAGRGAEITVPAAV